VDGSALYFCTQEPILRFYAGLKGLPGDRKMNYSSIILASFLALAGTAQATDNSQFTEDEISDVRLDCISMGISDELDDSQMETFVEQCVNDELAARQKSRDTQGQAAVL
jgi:hypothetical protein